MTVIAGGLITLEFAAEGLSFKDVGVQGNVARDADLTAYVQAATPVIENLVGPVLPVTKTVAFQPGGAFAIVLHDRVNELTSVTDGTTVLDPSGYYLDEAASILYGGSPTGWRSFNGPVTVVYTTGFEDVPMVLQLATRELVRFWWQQGKAAPRPAFNETPQTDSQAPQGFAVPRRVIELCGSYLNTEFGFA